MGCTYCTGTALVEVSFPDHPVAVAVVCLGCGAAQPVAQGQEQQ